MTDPQRPGQDTEARAPGGSLTDDELDDVTGGVINSVTPEAVHPTIESFAMGAGQAVAR